MRQVWWRMCAAAVLPLSLAHCQGKSMTVEKIELKFAPMHLESSGEVNSMRMVKGDGRATIAMLAKSADGAPTLSMGFFDVSGGVRARPVFRIDSPFGMPSWDVTVTTSGLAAVWTEPGSAISPLGYRAANAPPITLTGRYASGVFQNPRFVRGEPLLKAEVTSVAYAGPSRLLALFSEGLAGGQALYTSLPPIGAGLLLDGLLLRNGTGYVLITKHLAPGPRGADRKDKRGESILPGVLHCSRLNSKFEPAGASGTPFGDQAVFEFDADLSGGRLVVLATTAKSISAASATVSETMLSWSASVNLPVAGEPSAPAVLSTDRNSAVAAVIDGIVSPAQILGGQISFGAKN